MNEMEKKAPQETSKTTVRPNSPRRTYWLRNMRDRDNLFLFEATLRFIGNLVAGFKGKIHDADTFLPVEYLMRREKALDMFYVCTTEAVRKAMQGGAYNHIFDPDNEQPRDLFKALWKHPKSNLKFRHCMEEWLAYACNALKALQAERPDPVKDRFAELQRLFSLSDREIEVLTVETVLANGIWPTDDFRKVNPFQKVAQFSALLGINADDYLKLIDSRSKLRRLGCLDEDGNFNTALLHFLTGMDNTPLASRYYRRIETEPLPWGYFGNLADKHGSFLKRLLAGRPADRGMNILLYGEPGTGKTSFAVSLAAELGLTPYFVSQTDDSTDRPRGTGRAFRFAALQVCASQADPSKSLIVIDEADSLLSGSGGAMLGVFLGASASGNDKGVINDVMDTVKMPCVWITNTRAEALDTSNRRRFDYSIRFDSLTHVQREAIWRNARAKHGLEPVVTDALIGKLAARYQVNAGGIDLALRNLGSMLNSGQSTPGDAEQVLQKILEPHCLLLN
ncbi:MAG: ATP-binding protein, partial [bacterium]